MPKVRELVVSVNTDDFTTWAEAVSSAVDRYLQSAEALRQLLDQAPTINVEMTSRRPD